MAKRTTYVTVHNTETGESQTFGPDEDLPAWTKAGLTNPDVYEAPAKDQGPVPGPSQAEAADLIGETKASKAK